MILQEGRSPYAIEILRDFIASRKMLVLWTEDVERGKQVILRKEPAE